MCADVAVQLLFFFSADCCFFSEPETTNKNKENLVRVQKKRPELELGPGPKKCLQNMGSITSRGPKRISKTPIVSLQSHRRRDDLIKRCVIHPISRMFSNIRLGNFGAKF
jgi:hypothetical protein